ncbi:hypothetical protein DXG01_009820 [Tephrocybe rancida]|nr:hypothetical protein DXG01_009820 [Tephrocybe rancida]
MAFTAPRTTALTRSLARSFASLHNAPPPNKRYVVWRAELYCTPTLNGSSAIVMMNMGGPETVTETHDFLKNLFSDGDLIPLPFQRFLAPWIARRRTPQIEKQYTDIGGGSPILRYTKLQGEGMAKLLDELHPETAPHKAYVAFRYVRPLTEQTAAEMKADGVKRAIAFTQYPQYSCSTTGSSLNEMFRRGSAGDTEGIEWSVIDRWGTHPGFIEAVAQNIEAALAKFPASTRKDTILLFSAHSLPMSVVNRGDPYILEVSASVSAVMDRLGHSNPFRLVWQSQVGPSAWMGMQTGEALKGLARLGKKQVVLVPIAFTSDHIETLYELDLEYAEEARAVRSPFRTKHRRRELTRPWLRQHGIEVHRAESLNGSPVFIRALADIAAQHLKDCSAGKGPVSTQFGLRCPGCTNAICGQQKTWFSRGGRFLSISPFPSMAHTTVVSAPGKVLVSGGYLVLDPKYSGTVVSTSSRFYTVIREDASISANTIRVRSPQFSMATWEYAALTSSTAVSVEDLPINTSKNKFVHLALQITLTLVAEISGVTSVKEALSKGLDIAIVGDNDFYSQREKLASLQLPRTLSSLSQIPPFTPTGVPLSQVHKTGLGSSAALITSLVSGLLIHFSSIPADSLSSLTSDGRMLAHNVAQYVHCFAQGKVGSGFDVAAAVFGSHLYTRFNPAVLHGLMSDETLRSQALLPTLAPTNKAWDHAIKPFKLPPLTRLMLADVDAGSDTPSLVGKPPAVIAAAWPLALWTDIDTLNTRLAETLVDLSTLYEQDVTGYTTALKYIASLQHIQWSANPFQPEEERPTIAKFHDAHTISQAIRAKMREMGELSGVPIEPEEQTKLLDSCVSLAGVVGGGVPGAGGYDAIWLLVCDPVDASPDIPPLQRVEEVWSEYTELDVSPLSVVESLAGGARVETLSAIPGLAEATAPA